MCGGKHQKSGKQITPLATFWGDFTLYRSHAKQRSGQPLRSNCR